MKTTSLIAALGAATAAAGIAVIPASGQDQNTARTLTFVTTQKRGDVRSTDVKPKGDSPGDSYLLSSLMHRDGKIVGRVEAQCVELDATYQAQMCHIVAVLTDGQITLQGAGFEKRLPGAARSPEAFAITGGTGAYSGAAGSMTIKGNGQRDTLTFTLE
jgi:hypothetical protein